MSEQTQTFGRLVLAGLLSGGILASVLGAVLGFLFLTQTTRIQEGIKTEFQSTFEVFRSKREWQRQSLAELMGPVYMQLGRTKRGFGRLKPNNRYLETKVLAKGNETVLTLLLTKAHLIPPDLLECADRLVEHYDVWLEEFEEKRLRERPDLKTPFIFAGPQGFPFPTKCEEAFREKFEKMWKESYESR